MINVKFYGIDSWDRPVFKEVGKRSFYGSIDHLCSYGDSEQKVLEKVSANSLVFFGSSFDCEPCGTSVINIQILKGTK